jgi:hypothetical protein
MSTFLSMRCPSSCGSPNVSYWKHNNCAGYLKIDSSANLFCAVCSSSGYLWTWLFDCGNHPGDRWRGASKATVLAILMMESEYDTKMTASWTETLLLNVKRNWGS